MVAPPLRLAGFSRGSLAEVVAPVREALNTSGASIVDFHLLANAILCLSFELAAAKTPAEAKIRLERESPRAL